jgi:protein gp37
MLMYKRKERENSKTGRRQRHPVSRDRSARWKNPLKIVATGFQDDFHLSCTRPQVERALRILARAFF